MKSKENRAFLNRCAEVSGHEIKTHDFIVEVLSSLNPTKLYTSTGGHGVLAEFKFSKQGKTYLFRADMDAVGLHPDNAKHSCGHDGHIAILLDFATQLIQKPLTEGTILLLFQPSEENGNGAKAILNSKVLQNYSIDFAFALHNIPGYPLGNVLSKSGCFSSAVLSCEMHFFGKSSHASEPEKGISPQNTMFEIASSIQKLQNSNFSSNDYFLATLVELHLGEETYGVAPGNGILRWTFRAKSNAVLKSNITAIESLSHEIAIRTKELNFSINYLEEFYANENNPLAVEIITKAAKNCKLDYTSLEEGFRWGEDFGILTQQIPGAMFGIGAGENCPPLHSPDYNFPNELIEIGSRLFYEIASNRK
ncbi:MAG: amidohydrolase [Bacteroidota bacterium]